MSKEPRTPINYTIPTHIHNTIKAFAAIQEMNIEEKYIEILSEWKSKQKPLTQTKG